MKRLLACGCGLAAIATATPAAADVTIGPRFSYYFDNSNLRTSSLDDGQLDGPQIDETATRLLQDAFGDDALLVERDEGTGVRADQIGFPMVGAMVNFGDDRDRVTITAMYGEGSGSLSEIRSISRELSVGDIVVTDLGTFNAIGEVDTDRYDLEVTWQRRTSENFAFFAGARYERLETSGDVFLRAALTNNIQGILDDAAAIVAGDPLPEPPNQPPPEEAFAFQRAVLETYSVRAGVTAFVPFNEGSVAFFNGMLHASHQPDYDTTTDFFQPASGDFAFSETESVTGETSFGPDIAVGAQFTLAENIALDIRYRAILFFPLAGEQSFSDARVNHGVNLGVSFRL